MATLRGRTRDASWQWAVIGLLIGLGCAGLFCLGGYALNLIQFNVPGQQLAAAPTAVVIVITSTLSDDQAAQPTEAAAPSDPTAVATTVATSNAAAVSPATATSAISAVNPVGPTPTVGGIIIANNTANPASGTLITAPATVRPTLRIPDIAGGVNNPPTTDPAQVNALGTTATIAPAEGLDPLPTIQSANNLVGTELVEVRGGDFTMGTTQEEASRAVQDCIDRDAGTCELDYTSDSYPPRLITLDTFRIERYEVTYEQYAAFLNNQGAGTHLKGCGGQACVRTKAEEGGSYLELKDGVYSVTNPLYLDRPVSYVTWYGADSYCKALDRRLPTEAEWEKAARGTNPTFLYPWGDFWDETFALTSRPTDLGGQFPITDYTGDLSPYNVSGMAGNVSEWVFDLYDNALYRSAANTLNPQGPASGKTTRVVRGGNFAFVPLFARVVHRQDRKPLETAAYIGFRCAVSGGGTGDSGAGSGAPVVQPTPAGPLSSGAN